MKQIKLYYEDVVINLKDEISKCCYVSMLTDASRINKSSFITTTVLYIKDGDFNSHVLQTR